MQLYQVIVMLEETIIMFGLSGLQQSGFFAVHAFYVGTIMIPRTRCLANPQVSFIQQKTLRTKVSG